MYNVSTPVWATVSQKPGCRDEFSSELNFVESGAEDTENAAHVWSWDAETAVRGKPQAGEVKRGEGAQLSADGGCICICTPQNTPRGGNVKSSSALLSYY